MADDGTIVYLSANVAPPATRTLVWVDRQGRETPLGAEAQSYVHPRLAPDGTRVAVLNALNIWIWDLARARLTAGTLDGGNISIWTPDSSRIIFSSIRGGGSPNLYVQAADGTGTATRLTDSPNPQHPTGITPDATQVVLNEATPAALADIRLLTMTPTPQVKPLVETRFDERGGVVSPDGRWLAYESNRSGAYEVYVQPFPAVDRGLWQVSTGGGTQPLWARNGRELFYVAPDGALMGVPVEARGSVWSAGPPMRLVEGRYFSGGEGTTVRQYRCQRGRAAIPDDEGRGKRHQRCAVDQCRPELVRGTEAARADELNGLTVRRTLLAVPNTHRPIPRHRHAGRRRHGRRLRGV